jgi:hypothetical protein
MLRQLSASPGVGMRGVRIVRQGKRLICRSCATSAERDAGVGAAEVESVMSASGGRLSRSTSRSTCRTGRSCRDLTIVTALCQSATSNAFAGGSRSARHLQTAGGAINSQSDRQPATDRSAAKRSRSYESRHTPSKARVRVFDGYGEVVNDLVYVESALSPHDGPPDLGRST